MLFRISYTPIQKSVGDGSVLASRYIPYSCSRYVRAILTYNKTIRLREQTLVSSVLLVSPWSTTVRCQSRRKFKSINAFSVSMTKPSADNVRHRIDFIMEAASHRSQTSQALTRWVFPTGRHLFFLKDVFHDGSNINKREVWNPLTDRCYWTGFWYSRL